MPHRAHVLRGDRIIAVREMILADDETGRRAALAKLLPMQRGDFAELFEIMAGLPVTIRLLDPPLHEFLPHKPEEVAAVVGGDRRQRGKAAAPRRRTARDQPHAGPPRLPPGRRLPRDLRDAGARHHRGAPARSQTRPAWPQPGDHGPLVAPKAKMDFGRRASTRRQAVIKEKGTTMAYSVGAMIELPRAALRAGEIARNRGVLLLRHQRPHPDHLRHQPRRLRRVPGRLYRQGLIWRRIPSSPSTSRGRGRPGDDGGGARPRDARRTSSSASAASMAATPPRSPSANASGLDYVSCSPYRVPMARLAAAQAALHNGGATTA